MRYLIAALFVLLATSASAQPGCRSRILPEPPASAWGVPTNELGAQKYWALPPGPGEVYGHLNYAFGYHYPDTATNVGLMYFTAETPYWWGDTVNQWGIGSFDPKQRYVQSTTGMIPYLEDGILFEGYHILGDQLGPNGSEPTWEFRSTQHFGAAHSGALSIVLQPHEQWTIAANNVRYLGHTVLTLLQLHLRECFVEGQIPGGGR